MSMALEGGDTPQLPLALAVAVTTAVSSPSPVLLLPLRGPNPAKPAFTNKPIRFSASRGEEPHVPEPP